MEYLDLARLYVLFSIFIPRNSFIVIASSIIAWSETQMKEKVYKERGQYEAVDWCYSFSLCVFMEEKQKMHQNKERVHTICAEQGG